MLIAVLATELSKSLSLMESSIAAFVPGDRKETYPESLGSETMISSLMAFSPAALDSDLLSFAPNSSS